MTYFLLFHTIHDVLKAEKLLKRRGIPFSLVPVPRNLSSDCGSCVTIQGPIEEASECIAGVEIDRLFSYDGETFAALDSLGKECT